MLINIVICEIKWYFQIFIYQKYPEQPARGIKKAILIFSSVWSAYLHYVHSVVRLLEGIFKIKFRSLCGKNAHACRDLEGLARGFVHPVKILFMQSVNIRSTLSQSVTAQITSSSPPKRPHIFCSKGRLFTAALVGPTRNRRNTACRVWNQYRFPQGPFCMRQNAARSSPHSVCPQESRYPKRRDIR